MSDTQQKIDNTTNSLAHLLKEKNKRYGDSALNPLGVFTGKTTPLGIGVRLDDKIARIMNSTELRKNDVCDLMGYLTLLCCANSWTNFDEFID